MIDISEFDIHRDFKWLAIGSFALYYLLGFAVCCLTKGNCNPRELQFYLIQVVFVPVLVFAVIWTYQHPEQVENRPDGWMSDLRPIWPVFAIIDLCFVAVFLSGREVRRKAYYLNQATRYMDIGNELYREGNRAEAEYAWANARWILDHKWKRK